MEPTSSKQVQQSKSTSNEHSTNADARETKAGSTSNHVTESAPSEKEVTELVDKARNKEDKLNDSSEGKLEKHGYQDQVGNSGDGQPVAGSASYSPETTTSLASMSAREGYKRSASMTQLIDDIIEKQIRLTQEETDKEPPSLNCSLVDNFVRKEMQADSEESSLVQEEK